MKAILEIGLPPAMSRKLMRGGVEDTDRLRVLTTDNLMATFKLGLHDVATISAALVQAGQEPLPDPVGRLKAVRHPNVPGRCLKHVGEVLCGREKYANKASCLWHWLLDQPIAIQVDVAIQRALGAQTLGKPYRARVPEREWPTGTRWCSGCQNFIPTFYCQGSRCHACASRAAHAGMIERTYDLSSEQYDALLAWQHGRCYICQRRPLSKRLAVDHDHESGLVRGLLCADNERGCNHAILGNIRSLAMARRIVAYLEKTPMERLADGEAPPMLDNTRRAIPARLSMVDPRPITDVFSDFL